MKRGRLGRLLQILIALQSGQNNRADDLAKMHGLSRRTIFRDLKELKESSVPVSYNAQTRTYSIDPVFFLPPTNLDRIEALGLLLLARKARNYIELPFRSAVLSAAMKLESNLPSEVRQFCNTSLQNISVKVKPQIRPPLNDEMFWQLQNAISKKRVVNIHCYSRSEGGNIYTDLSPYYLLYNEYAWYVIGNSSFHNNICDFKLNYIKQLKMLDKCFVETDKLDIKEYLGRAWSMRPEGLLYNIRLRFLPEIAHTVAEVQWHSTQKVTFEDDGSAIVEFRIDGLNEIKWWILSYGDRVQVLAPRALRHEIIKIARKMVGNTACQQKKGARFLLD